MERKQASILEGTRIIDCAYFVAGTGAGALLGELGAEVIKIEDPVRGDSYRGMTVQYGDAMSVKGRHIGFETTNLNKKSITLDLSNNEGKEILYKLVAKSDVFLTNFSRRIVNKLGLDYETLKTHSPKLVYGKTTLYGRQGRLSERRGFDTLAQAYSGAMWAMGDRDFAEPVGKLRRAYIGKPRSTDNTLKRL
ncbi:MAG: CoA transferase [Chloroflexi bacterium]|nr:CoA transferase [Chloroflexota bacterium]